MNRYVEILHGIGFMVVSPTSCFANVGRLHGKAVTLKELEVVNVLLSSTVDLLTIPCNFIKLSTIQDFSELAASEITLCDTTVYTM